MRVLLFGLGVCALLGVASLSASITTSANIQVTSGPVDLRIASLRSDLRGFELLLGEDSILTMDEVRIVTLSDVPEPGTMIVIPALLGLLLRHRRR